MKIRNGFVSNSSSSSFVVHYRKNSWSSPNKDYQTVLLSKEQWKNLKKFGFRYSNVSNPAYVGTLVEQKDLTLKSFKRYDEVYLTFDVTCNQNDVIYFLLKNKIPFVALCHYDQELVVWDGKTECFYSMPNVLDMVSQGNGVVNHDVGEQNQYFPVQLCPKITQYKIDEWLENERKWMSVTEESL